MKSAVTWFEIPATDLNRAAEFYGRVIGRDLVRESMGPAQMAVFPYDRDSGVGGCVVAAEIFHPCKNGSVVYLHVGKDMDGALTRARAAGAHVALEKTALPGDMGSYAHIIDTEGNRVGLHAA